MQKLINDVAAFHIACDQPVLTEPRFVAERAPLRLSLCNEENRELNEAVANENLSEIADAIADNMYVLIGTAIEFGIPLAAVWNAVQNANLAKLDPKTGKAIKREDGKVLKPEGWTPPDIAGVLAGTHFPPLPTSQGITRQLLVEEILEVLDKAGVTYDPDTLTHQLNVKFSDDHVDATTTIYAAHNVVNAWEDLPSGEYSAKDIKVWLNTKMAQAIQGVRNALGRERPSA